MVAGSIPTPTATRHTARADQDYGWGTEESPPAAPIVLDPGPGSGNGSPEGNIDWTTPTGTDLAKDQTLQDVGDILHNDLQSGLSNIGAQTAGTRLGVDGLAGKLDAINGTLLAGNGAAQLSELQSINAGQAAANAFLSTIDASTSNVALSAATSANQLGNILAAINAGDPLSDDILAKLGEIGLATQAGSDGITTSLVPDLTAIRAAIDVLKSQGTTENNWLQQIEDHTEDIRGNAHNSNVSLNEIEADAETIKDNTDLMVPDIEEIKDNTEEIAADTDQIDQNTDDIEPKLEAIKDSIDARPDYTTILGEIRDNTGTTASNTSSMDTTLDDIRTAVQSIDEKTPDATDQPTPSDLETAATARQAEADSAAAQGRSTLEEFGNKAPAYTGPATFAVADNSPFVIQAVGLAGTTYDISTDPLDHPMLVLVLSWVRTLIAWTIGILVPYYAYNRTMEHMVSVMMAGQAIASGQAVAGTNYNLIASKVAAAAIVAAATGVIIFTSTYLSGTGFSLASASFSPPVESTGLPVSIALHYLDAILPLATLITGFLTFLALNYAIGPITFGALTLVKFLNI